MQFSSAPPQKLECFIDGKKVLVDPGTTVLQAAAMAGVEIPEPTEPPHDIIGTEGAVTIVPFQPFALVTIYEWCSNREAYHPIVRPASVHLDDEGRYRLGEFYG